MTRDILTILNGKWEDGTRPADLYSNHMKAQPELFIEILLKGLGSAQARVRNGCAELASLLSADRPDLLLPYFKLFASALSSDQPVLRWEAACTIGNLAATSTLDQVHPCVPSLLEFLENKSIVLQGHAVRALAKIAGTFEKTAEEILDGLIAAQPMFPGTRTGFLVEAMVVFVNYQDLAPRAREFVLQQQSSPTPSVARKADKAMKVFG